MIGWSLFGFVISDLVTQLVVILLTQFHEPSRLNYQYEELQVYYDVDLYIEVYNRDLDIDYLLNFEEDY